jgi:hypothetical protein
MVTYEELFLFCTVIISIITLVFYIQNSKK